jgi:hypothetical protein
MVATEVHRRICLESTDTIQDNISFDSYLCAIITSRGVVVVNLLAAAVSPRKIVDFSQTEEQRQRTEEEFFCRFISSFVEAIVTKEKCIVAGEFSWGNAVVSLYCHDLKRIVAPEKTNYLGRFHEVSRELEGESSYFKEPKADLASMTDEKSVTTATLTTTKQNANKKPKACQSEVRIVLFSPSSSSLVLFGGVI